MKSEKVLCRVCIALCATAFLVSAGCAKSKFQDPSPEQIRAFLDGQEITMADVKLPIFASDISSFKLVEIIAEPKDSHASALVTFSVRMGSQ